MSKEEIEKIKEGLRKMLFNTMEANECGLSNNDFKEDIEILKGAIQYMEQLEFKVEAREMEHNYAVNMIDEIKGEAVKLYKEIRKQNEIIDKIAEQLAGLTIWNIEKDEPLILGDKVEVKQYFEKKVEEENENNI